MRRIFGLVISSLIVTPALAESVAPSEQARSTITKKEVLTDAAIIAALIAASIAAYRSGGPGPCACPEDRDRAGHRCGKRSAHSRAGGWTVYCYASDISKEMIDVYRKSHGG